MGLRKSTKRALRSVIRFRDYQIFGKFEAFTMIPAHAYVSNLGIARKAGATLGAIVECGTWRGGMIAGIATVLGTSREYYLFDSFEGLPDAKPIDGEKAKEWQNNPDDPFYHDNCSASMSQAEEAMAMSKASSVKITKGWFSDTLHKADFPHGIALLRLDGEWYDSTVEILESLFPQVNVGGLLVIDDYFAWDGCSRAVHDYLSKNGCSERIETIDGVCVIKKRAKPDKPDGYIEKHLG